MGAYEIAKMENAPNQANAATSSKTVVNEGANIVVKRTKDAITTSRYTITVTRDAVNGRPV